MGSHPINLLVRFLLELLALLAIGLWGWNSADGLFRYILVIAAPIIAAAFWGVFAVPNDPSRSGSAPIPIPGWLRLILELTIFILAAAALFETGYHRGAYVYLVLVAIHYGFSYDRILWLVSGTTK